MAKPVESFRPPFLKGGAVKGAQPLSHSAECETLLSAFSFCKAFSLVPLWSREKASNSCDKLHFDGEPHKWGVPLITYNLRKLHADAQIFIKKFVDFPECFQKFEKYTKNLRFQPIIFRKTIDK